MPLPAGAADLFAHVSADKAPMYRAVLQVFAQARKQYRLQLRPDEVLAEADWPGAPPRAEELAVALEQLVEGQPAAAQRSLLQQLRDGGARLHYHGDFDWPGIQIANWVQPDFGARPWRMAAADYLAAAADTVASGPLAGRPLLARWDPGLTEAMRDRARAVAEESLLASLLPDLRA